MKKAIYIVFIVIALLFVGAVPGQAQWHGHGHGHGHGHSFFSGGVFIGPGWGGWGPWWWGPPGYPYGAYPYDYWEPPVVMQEQRQVYSQPTPQPDEESYWYFCPDPQGYYPYVKKCPKGWLRVIPAPAPPDWRE